MKKSNREAKLFLKEEGKKSSCGGIRSGGSQSHNLPYSGRVEGQKRLNMGLRNQAEELQLRIRAFSRYLDNTTELKRYCGGFPPNTNQFSDCLTPSGIQQFNSVLL